MAAPSAAAAAAGVRVGMPLAQAESMCPALVRRPLDLAYLAHESERLLAVLEAHVAVEPAKPGSALFGGQGMGAGGWGAATGSLLVPRPLAPGPPLDPQRQLAWLVDALAASTGYVAAVVVAEGRGAAWIAARRAAAGAVQAQFGPEGRLAWEIAHGRDRRPLAPRTPPCIPSAALAFDTPCADRAQLLAAMDILIARALPEVSPGQVVGSLYLVLEREGGPPGPPTLGREAAITLVPQHWGGGGGYGCRSRWRCATRRRRRERCASRCRRRCCTRRCRRPSSACGSSCATWARRPRSSRRCSTRAARRGWRSRPPRGACARASAPIRFSAWVALDTRHRLPERRYALVEAS